MQDELQELSGLKGILDRVQLWTAAADQKTEVLTAIETLAAGFLLPEISDWLDGEHTTLTIKVALHVACALLAAGFATSVYALFPRTEPSSGSVTFFGTIRGWELADYRQRLDAISTDVKAWRDDYTSQIHECSRIAMTKFTLLKTSVNLFGGGLLLLAVTYLAALGGL